MIDLLDNNASSARAMGPGARPAPRQGNVVDQLATGDGWFFLAGAVFTAAHAQIVVPALAPLGLLVAFVLGSLSRQKGSAHIRLVGVAVFMIAALGIAVGRMNGLQEDVALPSYIRERAPFVYVALVIVTFALLRPSRASAESFCAGFAVVAGVIALMTIGVALSGSEYFLDVRWVRRGRYQGLLSGPNSLAGLLAPAALSVVALWRSPLRGWGLVRLPVLVTTTFALMMTSSRGYLLGTLLGAAVLGGMFNVRQWRSKAAKTIGGVVVVGLLAGAAFAAAAERITSISDDKNVASRVDYWDRGLDLWGDSPLIGYGFGIFEQHGIVLETSIPFAATRAFGDYREALVQFDADGGQHAHNFYIQMGVDVGLIGLGAYLTFLVFGARRSSLAKSLLALGALAGVFGGYALASPSGSAPLLVLCLAGFDRHQRDRMVDLTVQH